DRTSLQPIAALRRRRQAAIGPHHADTRATLTRMTTWEYATVPLLIHATKQILDTWGQDGWELVQVVPGPNAENMVAYLKRPVEG
ncbi:MAG: hypothetical protein RLZZ163_267, partial [Actinomycetota bacterium]